jgi:hypothetical protein
MPAMNSTLALRWFGLAKVALLVLVSLLAVPPSKVRAQQPPLEGALAVEPEKPREELAQPGLTEGESVFFAIHRAGALILAPLVEWGVENGLLGAGAGGVGGLKIRPGSLGPGAGIAASVGYVYFSEPFWAGASAGGSVKGYQEHALFIGARDRRAANYVRATGTYDLDTEDEFSGLGMKETSPENGETDYRQEEWRILGDGQVALAEIFRVGARGGYRKETILSGKNDSFEDTQVVFSDSSLPGVGILPGLLDKVAKYTHVGGFAAIDTRNDARNPDRGVLLAGSFDAFRGASDTPFDWDRWAGEFAGYLPLPDETRVIAVRALAVHQNPREDQTLVPFYFLSSLGGSNLLRSFSSFRFQDNDVLYGAAEFRRRVWTERQGQAALDASLFVETGGVYRDLGDSASLSQMEQSFGTELRVLVPNDVLARIGFAVGSTEGSKFYVGGGGRF